MDGWFTPRARAQRALPKVRAEREVYQSLHENAWILLDMTSNPGLYRARCFGPAVHLVLENATEMRRLIPRARYARGFHSARNVYVEYKWGRNNAFVKMIEEVETYAGDLLNLAEEKEKFLHRAAYPQSGQSGDSVLDEVRPEIQEYVHTTNSHMQAIFNITYVPGALYKTHSYPLHALHKYRL